MLMKLYCLCLIYAIKSCYASSFNNRPIIGVLAQATSGSSLGDTYIPANYVKYLEEAGARVVPIRVREHISYYQKLFYSINGILFPGGSVGVATSDYAKAGRIIYELAKKANNVGDHFPLWGTCQGFQLLTNLTANAYLLGNTDCFNIALPLNLTQGYRSSQIFKSMSSDLVNVLTKEAVTPNFHNYGLYLKTFDKTVSLNKFYRLLSTNRDRQGVEFVSTIEAIKYPFYGTQWHPEKINFDWDPTHKIDHSTNGVAVTQYFSTFFVNQARLSNHTFGSEQDAANTVIQNCFMKYQADGTFQQMYYINYTKHG